MTRLHSSLDGFTWSSTRGTLFHPRRCLPLLCALVCLLLSAAVSPAQPAPQKLRIAAAADLEPVLPSVLEQFERQTGLHTEATYQSSATLAQQILNGAPFDIFLAADMGFPTRVIERGLAVEPKPVPYARGTLVLWARRDAPVLRGDPLTFAVLRNPALQSVAIANPDNAPYGRAARSSIASLHLESTLAPKLRLASNIAQAAQFVDSGNAEVGFLSLTSASTARLRMDGTWVPVPTALYPPLVQGAVTIRRSAGSAASSPDARKLLDYLATPAAESLLAKSGLRPPK